MSFRTIFKCANRKKKKVNNSIEEFSSHFLDNFSAMKITDKMSETQFEQIENNVSASTTQFPNEHRQILEDKSCKGGGANEGESLQRLLV